MLYVTNIELLLMTPTQLFVIVLVFSILFLVVRRILRLDIAALMIAVILGWAQYIGIGVLGEAGDSNAARLAVSGFSQPVITTLVGLFIMTQALDRLGVTRWIAMRLIAWGGNSERRLIVLFTSAAAAMALFMNNVAVGALLLPSAMNAARRSNIRPSKLLMPVAYGTLLGGIATYFTTANIVLSDLLTTAEPAQKPLGILDFTPVGGLMMLVGILYIAMFASKLLPERTTLSDQMMSRRSESDLENAYQIHERMWQAEVLPNSRLIGRTIIQASIGEQLGVTVIAILKQGRMFMNASMDVMLQRGDALLVMGNEERVSRLADLGLQVRRDLTRRHLSALSLVMVEMLPLPHSDIEGKNLRDLNFRRSYGFTAVALWREGQSHHTDVGSIPIRSGDSLLVVGAEEMLRRLRRSPDFIILEPDLSEMPMNRAKVRLAGGITLLALGAALAGMPVYLAMLSGAILMLLTNLVTIEEAYRSVEWQTVFLIAGMYTVSLAMVQTGLAELIGDEFVHMVAPFGTLGLIAGSYMLAAGLTQVMGSQVTALVVGPIAISASLNLGINPQAVAIATAIGCSASFLTPLAHPINLLVMGPGNYQFTDYPRLGWGLLVVTFITLLIGMEIFWL